MSAAINIASVNTFRAKDELVGSTKGLQNVWRSIELVARTDSAVLIHSETGTGKELVARAIHRYRSSRDTPFLPVHLSALNPNLVETE